MYPARPSRSPIAEQCRLRLSHLLRLQQSRVMWTWQADWTARRSCDCSDDCSFTLAGILSFALTRLYARLQDAESRHVQRLPCSLYEAVGCRLDTAMSPHTVQQHKHNRRGRLSPWNPSFGFILFVSVRAMSSGHEPLSDLSAQTSMYMLRVPVARVVPY